MKDKGFKMLWNKEPSTTLLHSPLGMRNKEGNDGCEALTSGN